MQAARADAGLEEIERYARRHGLHRLERAHLARLSELVDPVARFGFAIERVTDKFQSAADRQDGHDTIHTTEDDNDD